MSDHLPPLREAVNVPDALERDRIVRRFKKSREIFVGIKNDIEHWNRTHPNEAPLGTEVEDAFIAYLDGKAPYPTTFTIDGKPHAFVDGKLREMP